MNPNTMTGTVTKTAQKATTDSKKILNSTIDTLTDFAEEVGVEVKKSSADAQKAIQSYAKTGMDLARRHPVYATLAVVGVGFAIGSWIMRKKD